MTDLVWDDRLISQERAMRLAGNWPVYASVGYAQLDQYDGEDGQKQPGRWQLNRRCGRCHQSVALMATLSVSPGSTLIDEVQYTAGSLTGDLAAVLRHLVTAHDVKLSGAEEG